jgi:D-alanyl-D-alanine endopeptidase (penicillin-binding protein 7)
MIQWIFIILLLTTPVAPIPVDPTVGIPSVDANGAVSFEREHSVGGSVGAAPARHGESIGVMTSSESVVVMDLNSGAILFQKDAQRIRPIASLSKLLTVQVVLDHLPGWQSTATLSAEDNLLSGAKLQENAGEPMTVEQLFWTSLIGSANNATSALAHATGLTNDEFREAMNVKARVLGAEHAEFFEPTGLDERNQATAQDVALIARAAFQREEILKPAGQSVYEFDTLGNHTHHRVQNPNKVFKTFLDVRASKTGFTYEAGYCLASLLRGPNGQEIVIVVLGGESEEERVSDTKALATWAWEHYTWN